VLEVPEGTARSRLHYARLKLAEVLAPALETPAANKRREME